MELTRREFLRLAAGTAALPSLVGQWGCSAITAGDPEAALPLGYVAGDVTDHSSIIWLKAAADGEVAVQYGTDPALGQFSTEAPIALSAETDGTAHVKLDGLEPATTYYYRAMVTGKTAGPIARFKTAPQAGDERVVKFCFSGDSRESYQPFTIMDAIRANQPDFFIHLGDTIYADRGGAATLLPDFWAKYRANRADPASRRLFSETSVYVIWDDHEVANDYEGFHPLAATGRRAFFDYWPVERDLQEPDRLYRSFRWGNAMEVFLLDARQYRDRKKGTLLGRRQKQWLFDSLASSTALFKCIATSVPLYGGGKDRWDGYPRERSELVQWLKQKNITGAFFIAADLHYGAVTKVPGGVKLREIVAGPIAAPLNVLATGLSNRFEFFFNQNFNFGMITVDPKSSPPQLLIELRDTSNGVLYQTKIAAA